MQQSPSIHHSQCKENLVNIQESMCITDNVGYIKMYDGRNPVDNIQSLIYTARNDVQSMMQVIQDETAATQYYYPDYQHKITPAMK